MKGRKTKWFNALTLLAALLAAPQVGVFFDIPAAWISVILGQKVTGTSLWVGLNAVVNYWLRTITNTAPQPLIKKGTDE